MILIAEKSGESTLKAHGSTTFTSRIVELKGERRAHNETVRIEADNAEDFPILRTSTMEATAKSLIKLADLVSPKGSEGRG